MLRKGIFIYSFATSIFVSTVRGEDEIQASVGKSIPITCNATDAKRVEFFVDSKKLQSIDVTNNEIDCNEDHPFHMECEANMNGTHLSGNRAIFMMNAWQGLDRKKYYCFVKHNEYGDDIPGPMGTIRLVESVSTLKPTTLSTTMTDTGQPNISSCPNITTNHVHPAKTEDKPWKFSNGEFGALILGWICFGVILCILLVVIYRCHKKYKKPAACGDEELNENLPQHVSPDTRKGENVPINAANGYRPEESVYVIPG